MHDSAARIGDTSNAIKSETKAAFMRRLWALLESIVDNRRLHSQSRCECNGDVTPTMLGKGLKAPALCASKPSRRFRLCPSPRLGRGTNQSQPLQRECGVQQIQAHPMLYMRHLSVECQRLHVLQNPDSKNACECRHRHDLD